MAWTWRPWRRRCRTPVAPARSVAPNDGGHWRDYQLTMELPVIRKNDRPLLTRLGEERTSLRWRSR